MYVIFGQQRSRDAITQGKSKCGANVSWQKWFSPIHKDNEH